MADISTTSVSYRRQGDGPPVARAESSARSFLREDSQKLETALKEFVELRAAALKAEAQVVPGLDPQLDSAEPGQEAVPPVDKSYTAMAIRVSTDSMARNFRDFSIELERRLNSTELERAAEDDPNSFAAKFSQAIVDEYRQMLGVQQRASQAVIAQGPVPAELGDYDFITQARIALHRLPRFERVLARIELILDAALYGSSFDRAQQGEPGDNAMDDGTPPQDSAEQAGDSNVGEEGAEDNNVGAGGGGDNDDVDDAEEEDIDIDAELQGLSDYDSQIILGQSYKLPPAPKDAQQIAKEKADKLHSDGVSDANTARELQYVQSLKTLNITGRRYIHHNVEGDGNCMLRALSGGLLASEHLHPQVRGDLNRHLLESMGASSSGLDLSEDLMDYYMRLNEQSEDIGEYNLFEQIMYNGAWGTVELAEVFAILYDVEVLIHTPHWRPNQYQPEWQLLVRGSTGQNLAQVHIINWTNSRHWTYLRPEDPSQYIPVNTASLLASQRSAIHDHHNTGGFMLPRIDRNRFIHVENPTQYDQVTVERPSEDETISTAPAEDDDYTEADLPRLIEGQSLPPMLMRKPLPYTPLAARDLEVSSGLAADEWLVKASELIRRNRFDFMQFGKARVIDRREFLHPPTEAEQDLADDMRELSMVERFTQATDQAADDDTAMLDAPSGKTTNQLDTEEDGSTTMVFMDHTTGEHWKLPVQLGNVQVELTDAAYLMRYGRPAHTWMCFGRFSGFRPPHVVQIYLISHTPVLEDLHVQIHQQEQADPQLMPQIGHPVRVKRYWMNGVSAAQPLPTYHNQFVIPEHLAVQHELHRNHNMMPRPVVYWMIRSMSGFSVAPLGLAAIQNRWPHLQIWVYFALREGMANPIINNTIPGVNTQAVRLTPRSPLGFYYNVQAIDFNDLVSAEMTHGASGNALADAIHELRRMEYAVRAIWVSVAVAAAIWVRSVQRNRFWGP